MLFQDIARMMLIFKWTPGTQDVDKLNAIAEKGSEDFIGMV